MTFTLMFENKPEFVISCWHLCDPVGWIAHVMSFMPETVPKDPEWQVPAYYFAKDNDRIANTHTSEPGGHDDESFIPRSECKSETSLSRGIMPFVG